jgi:hypothetical protein
MKWLLLLLSSLMISHCIHTLPKVFIISVLFVRIAFGISLLACFLVSKYLSAAGTDGKIMQSKPLNHGQALDDKNWEFARKLINHQYFEQV